MQTVISQSEDILRLASTISGKTPITLHYCSLAKLNKRDRVSMDTFDQVFKDVDQSKVLKHTVVDCFIGFDYEKEKRDAGVKEEIGQDTIPKETWYDDFIKNGAVKRHKLTGDLYLWILIADKPSRSTYINKDNGQEIDLLKLVRFLPKSNPSKVSVKTIKISNIKELKVDI